MPIKVLEEILGAALAAAVITALVVWLATRRRARRRQPLPLFVDVRKTTSLEELSTAILREISQWVPGEAFQAYWLGTDRERLLLRGSLQPAVEVSVSPNYSGLAAESKHPAALAISLREIPDEVAVTGNRKERWVLLPFGSDLAVKVLLERGKRISRAKMARLRLSTHIHAPLMQALNEWFRARQGEERLHHLAASGRTALDASLKVDTAVELLLRVGGGLLDASAQFAILDGSTGPFTVADSRDNTAWGERLIAGEFQSLLALGKDPDVLMASDLHLPDPTIRTVVRVPIIANEDPLGCFFYLLAHPVTFRPYELAALRTLGQRAAQVMASQHKIQEASKAYVSTLKTLVQTMDGLSPHSVGHASRMSYYARLTATELGLAERDVEAVALAAHLHDVGMVAVDAQLVLKPQQFSLGEYEQMKAHAHLGGQLLRALPGFPGAADMVASHHERWDGNGYPDGLKGEEIPLGARIIAAVDLFEAKTTSRSYREPRTFNQAIEDVRAAAGTALDPQVVQGFTASLERTRKTASPSLPLAACWEWKQMPEHVCSGCPNRTKGLVRCWESPVNLCTRHGDRCETCVIYTEATARGLVSAK